MKGTPKFNVYKWRECPTCPRKFRQPRAKQCIDCQKEGREIKEEHVQQDR